MLTAAGDGRGELVLLAGDPGIGKTRLAEEAERSALEAGMGVAWGRCWEAGGAPAFWPWIQALRSVASAHGEADLPEPVRALVGEAAPDETEARPTVRGVRRGRRAAPDLEPREPAADRARRPARGRPAVAAAAAVRRPVGAGHGPGRARHLPRGGGACERGGPRGARRGRPRGPAASAAGARPGRRGRDGRRRRRDVRARGVAGDRGQSVLCRRDPAAARGRGAAALGPGRCRGLSRPGRRARDDPPATRAAAAGRRRRALAGRGGRARIHARAAGQVQRAADRPARGRAGGGARRGARPARARCDRAVPVRPRPHSRRAL